MSRNSHYFLFCAVHQKHASLPTESHRKTNPNLKKKVMISNCAMTKARIPKWVHLPELNKSLLQMGAACGACPWLHRHRSNWWRCDDVTAKYIQVLSCRNHSKSSIGGGSRCRGAFLFICHIIPAFLLRKRSWDSAAGRVKSCWSRRRWGYSGIFGGGQIGYACQTTLS